MRTDYEETIIRMLQSQLNEEEENYKLVLTNKKEFEKLKNIKQRIKSLRNCLNSIRRKELQTKTEITISKERFYSN